MKKLVLALALSVPAVSNAAGLVFSDGFENGTGNFTGEAAGRGAVSQARDGGRPRSGGKMLELSWNGAVAYGSSGANMFATLDGSKYPYNQEFLMRWWYREDSNFDHSNGVKVLRHGRCGALSANYKDNDVLHEVYIAYTGDLQCPNTILNVWCKGSGGGDGCNGPSWVGDRQWHKQELYVKIGNPGRIKRWHDGRLLFDREANTALGGAGTWQPMHFGSNWSNNRGWEHDSANSVYLDDVEFYSDAGNGGSGSLAEATIGQSGGGSSPPDDVPPPPPPADNSTLPPPSNLRVVQ